MKNNVVLTFDVEDWFNVLNMKSFFPYEKWKKEDLRVEVGIKFILKELKNREIKATFFVLGWIAEYSPGIIKEISDDGHEIATHGYNHQSLQMMNRSEFEFDLNKSIELLKKICGKAPTGYRAPSFSITRENFWALDVINKSCLQYDSSIFPISHPDYGISDFSSEIQKIDGLIEVPIRSYKLGRFTIPIAGGGYFRLLPYLFTKWALSRALKDNCMIMYFHPWEFDPDQPYIKIPLFKRFRHYVGLKRNRSKFISLLNDFKFITMEEHIKKEL